MLDELRDEFLFSVDPNEEEEIAAPLEDEDTEDEDEVFGDEEEEAI